MNHFYFRILLTIIVAIIALGIYFTRRIQMPVPLLRQINSIIQNRLISSNSGIETKTIPSTKPTPKPKPPLSQNEKVVLFYTKYFRETRWPEAGINKNTLKFQDTETEKPCEYKCRLTYDKNELHTSDAVIFHGRDLPGNLAELSRNRRNFEQRWVYYTMESPYNSGDIPNDIFNWTMTHQSDSDIHFPYFQYRALSPDEVSKVKVNTNHAHGKTNLVTWSVSNCDSKGLRDKITEKMTLFLPIVINGRCASLFPNRKNVPPCGRYEHPNCKKLYHSTKFYLSFENSLCPGYITEKYYDNPLGVMLPIVYGPKEYYDELAIPGSYINLYDFPSIQSLANYIKYLDKNDTAYNEYFKWQHKYKITRRNAMCKFCEKLHDVTLPPKTYNDLRAFYSMERCDKNLKRVKQYLK